MHRYNKSSKGKLERELDQSNPERDTTQLLHDVMSA